MRKINILGLNLQDYTLRETMRLMETYLNNGALNTIACASAQMLMQAGEDVQQKEWLESMDMIQYCDIDILRAAGITAHNRLKEVENNSFFKEFFKKIAKERRTVYLLADTDETMGLLEDALIRVQEPMGSMLRIAGRGLWQKEEMEGSADDVINDINDKAPNVILALMAYPRQEEFIFYNKDRINADIWLGLQREVLLLEENHKGFRALAKKLQKKIFQRKVHQYENQEKAEP